MVAPAVLLILEILILIAILILIDPLSLLKIVIGAIDWLWRLGRATENKKNLLLEIFVKFLISKAFLTYISILGQSQSIVTRNLSFCQTTEQTALWWHYFKLKHTGVIVFKETSRYCSTKCLLLRALDTVASTAINRKQGSASLA